MSAPGVHRIRMRRLYRAIRVEGRKWPHRLNRVSRSLFTVIPQVTQAKFREAMHEKDGNRIRAFASEGALELFAIQRLRTNEYWIKYPMKRIQPPRMIQENYDLRELSDEYQKKHQNKGWGFTVRILDFFLGGAGRNLPAHAPVPGSAPQAPAPAAAAAPTAATQASQKVSKLPRAKQAPPSPPPKAASSSQPGKPYNPPPKK